MGIELMQNGMMFLKQGNGAFHLKQPAEVKKNNQKTKTKNPQTQFKIIGSLADN